MSTLNQIFGWIHPSKINKSVRARSPSCSYIIHKMWNGTLMIHSSTWNLLRLFQMVLRWLVGSVSKPSVSGQGINETWLRLGWNQKKRGTSLGGRRLPSMVGLLNLRSFPWRIYLFFKAFSGLKLCLKKNHSFSFINLPVLPILRNSQYSPDSLHDILIGSSYNEQALCKSFCHLQDCQLCVNLFLFHAVKYEIWNDRQETILVGAGFKTLCLQSLNFNYLLEVGCCPS